jgi:hypothetical protein
MKKDILFPKPEGVHFAAILGEDNLKQAVWEVFLINERNETLENVLNTSKGFGIVDNEMRKTSTLRRLMPDVPPGSALKIELIPQDLLSFTNEYWLSFYIGKQIFDKKYIFMPGSIAVDNCIDVPVINKRGVMIS